MTRINCIDPALLSNKHLGAEYRELPRVFRLVRKAVSRGEMPAHYLQVYPTYRLGAGHCLFFYARLGYLIRRYVDICTECRRRGRAVNYGGIADLIEGIPAQWFGEWTPDAAAIQLNIARINERGGNVKVENVCVSL